MNLQLFAVDPSLNAAYQGLMSAVEVLLYTATKKEAIKEIVVCNQGSADTKIYISRIPNATVGSAGPANRIAGGRVVVAGDTIIFALTTPLLTGWSITGRADLASNLCLTITTVDV